MNRAELELFLAQLPIAQYVFFRTKELTFSERVRQVCESECPRYGKSWACPPAVGTVKECQTKCQAFPEGLLLVTLTETDDISDMAKTLSTRHAHEQITHLVAEKMHSMGLEVYPLSTESCALCASCTYPHAPCIHPEKMYPCVESHGILITDLMEHYEIDYHFGAQVVTWVSVLLFKEILWSNTTSPV